MKNVFLALAWVFILAVYSYDVYFAWQYRSIFQLWELNPLARWIAQDYGLNILFFLKWLLLGFVLAVAGYCHLRRHYLELPYTLIVSVVHVMLSVHYVIGHTASV